MDNPNHRSSSEKAFPGNRSCPCQSGKKYKRCCRKKSVTNKSKTQTRSQPDIKKFLKKSQDRFQAAERIRAKQQGYGRPIITEQHKGFRFIAVGDRLHYSKNWFTMTDFLKDYIKSVLGKEFWESELAKQPQHRHIILQWAEKFHQFLNENQPSEEGEIITRVMTGFIHCYLGIAYNLYLLAHNVELQNRLINRLKRMDQFQGAYYELIVANSLIRAGFILELEDETDSQRKHCEFSATKPSSGIKYWVEAKSRSVVGILGKTNLDGVPSKLKDPTTKITSQVKEALAKPAEGQRLIFLDINTNWTAPKTIPSWIPKAEKRLTDKEKDLLENTTAYIFITNCPFHRDLEGTRSGMEIFPFGLGITDFAKNDSVRLDQKYKERQKHSEAYEIISALSNYPSIPPTLDGKLPSETLEKKSQRYLIGDTYYFSDLAITATIVQAMVNEKHMKIIYFVEDISGKQHITSKAITKEELSEYTSHPEAYFGVVQKPPNPSRTDYQLFEEIVAMNKTLSREQILTKVAESPDLTYWENLDYEDLVIQYSERIVNFLINN